MISRNGLRCVVAVLCLCALAALGYAEVGEITLKLATSQPPKGGYLGGMEKVFADELEKFTRTHELGDVIWPSYEVLFAKNLGNLVDEIKRRDLYLFDIWGYVPGSGPGGYWQQFTPPAGALDILGDGTQVPVSTYWTAGRLTKVTVATRNAGDYLKVWGAPAEAVRES